MTAGRIYRKWNRTFRVMQHERSGMFYLGGKQRGYPDYILDKLGDFLTEDEAQKALDKWAVKVAARVVVPEGCSAVKQGELF